MPRAVKKILLYGILLAAGAALGMQLVSDDSATGYNASMQTPFYGNPQGGAVTPANQVAGQVTNNTPNGMGYEQGTYVKLPNGQTYYYVQNSSPAPVTSQGQGGLQLGQQPGVGLSDPASVTQGYQTPGQILLQQPMPQTSVDRFADKTGELLQKTSQKGIDWVVSLFGKLTG